MFNGIEISETLLLTNTIILSCFLLITVAIAVWAFKVLHNRTDNENIDKIKKLKNRAQTDRHAAKQLERLERKSRKDKRESIWLNGLVGGLLILLMSANLFFAVIPGWTDYIKKDYVLYEGEFEVQKYTRSKFIILEDGTKLYGSLGLKEGRYSDTVVYSRRTKFALGVN